MVDVADRLAHLQVRELSLFGSVLRDDFSPGSDIDVSDNDVGRTQIISSRSLSEPPCLFLEECVVKMIRSVLAVWAVLLVAGPAAADDPLQVGVAQVEITPPLGFPMAGYYTERLATGTLNPLWAKAVVFRQGETLAAWVVCDLTGVAVDLSTAVRQRASKATGIPVANIVVSATHSHTAPDYYRALYDHLAPAGETATDVQRERSAYAGRLIDSTAQAIVEAHAAVQPVRVRSGSAEQATPVSFCRRFVMRDGSVRTWVGLKHPEAIRSAAPIDPEIGLLEIRRADDDATTGLISNFALHLDTVGGTQWSADYPYAIEQTILKAIGPDVISLFGTGCCGDINHADPTGAPRRSAADIGNALGATITAARPQLTPVETPKLRVNSRTVPLLLEEVSPAEVQHSLELIKLVRSGQKIEFFDHVRAYKQLVLDQLIHTTPHPETTGLISLGLSRTWRSIGASIPAEVTVVTLGSDVALVFLPGEVFSELGHSIKQASPFRTTLVMELSQCVESIYIPNRHAYAGGGYEVANSLVQAGSGERLVEAAVSLLRESATAVTRE